MNFALQAKTELIEIRDQAMLDFKGIADAKWDDKPLPEKWSKKEILGHLIDSATNNLRRFIIGQYEQGTKIVYHQDEWVKYQDYQSTEIEDVKMLWKLLNDQIVRVLDHLPEDKLNHTCDTGKGKVELHTLSYFIEDYIAHLNYHLQQIKA